MNLIVALKNKLLRAPYVSFCSQTIYQALLGSIKMFEKTRDSKWKERSNYLIEVLIQIQCDDGGFDIGYDFNFGKLHKKGEATSPELIGLLAFVEYGRVFGYESVRDNIEKSLEWIKHFSIQIDENEWAIPYGPYSINQVMVYNGTSFACGALGYAIGEMKLDNKEYTTIYNGMVNYLYNQLSDSAIGKYWYYNDQSRSDLTVLARNKIDYYHQMQQVEIHGYAQQVKPNSVQEKLIEAACDHVMSIQNRDGSIPYTNDPESYFAGNIHTWGFSSAISGFIKGSELIKDKADNYLDAALKALDYLIDNAWNGDYFEAVLNDNGEKYSYSPYMVRSDAWIFNALAESYNTLSYEGLDDIIEKTFCKMEEVDFSGPESHASNIRIRSIGKIVKLLKKLR